MDEELARVVGHRVRFYRTAAHQTRTVVAGLTGVTPDYLYQIERGQKLPTVAVLAGRCAAGSTGGPAPTTSSTAITA